jgi:hypothetical protein
LLLHWVLLCWLLVVGLWVLSQLPVKDGELFIELTCSFREFVKSCPLSGVGGAVTRRRLWAGTARGRSHADIAFARRVMLPRGRCPPGRHKAEAALIVRMLLM